MRFKKMRIRCRSSPVRDAVAEESESGSTVSSAQSTSRAAPKKRTRRSRRPPAPWKEYKCGYCGRIFSTREALGRHVKSHTVGAPLGRRRKKVPPAPETTAERDSMVLHGGGSEKLEAAGWPAKGKKKRGKRMRMPPGHWGKSFFRGAALGGHPKDPRNAAAPLHLDLNSPPASGEEEEEEGGDGRPSGGGGDVSNHTEGPRNAAAPPLPLDLNSPPPGT